MLVTDLLIDPGCLADLMRDPSSAAAEAVARARASGARLWLSTALVPAYRAAVSDLAAFAAFAGTCQWVAALAGDGAAAAATEPQAELLALATQRLGRDARLLTGDAGLLARCPQAVAPRTLAVADLAAQPIAFIDLAAQQDRIRADLERRVHAVMRHGHFIMGPEIAELEAKLAAWVGARHAITVASGTDSLEIAYRALGIGAGDEVATVPFTWISSSETIAQVGARPVFCDIEPVGFNLDPARLAAALTAQTKAILPVSLFGQPCEAERIEAIAAARGIPVIEDAAQSFGATRHGRKSGALTRISSTSFFPAKPFGCYGDGGCLFTDDDALAAKMRAIRTHGGEKRHHHPYVGMNGRLDTLQAAILLAKLPQWEAEVAARGRIGARYSDALRGAVTVPEVLPGNTHVYAQYTIRVPGREAVAGKLKAAGIPTAVYYPKCLHEQPVFAPLGYRLGDFPESERATREVLSLPMHPDLDAATQDRIVAAVRQAVAP